MSTLDEIYETSSGLPVLIFGSGAQMELSHCIPKVFEGDLMDAILGNCSRCEYRNTCGLFRRLQIARELRDKKKGVPIILEIEFYRNGLLEEGAFIDLIEDAMIHQIGEEYLYKPLIVIMPEGPGSITEFNMYDQSELRNRIRLIVHSDNNPLYNEELGLLASQYLTFLGEMGYLFVYWKIEQLPLLARRIVEAEIKRILIVKQKFNNKKGLISGRGEENGERD
ncbi:MAG: hypothetical protein ACP6IP_09630 [Candidatus Njordarchaeia archaeon]